MRDSQKPLESIFSEAAEMSGEDRAAYLQSACANDPNLRRDVDRLLRALDQSGSFLSEKENSLANSPSTPFETAGSANASQVSLLTQAEGQQIGRYKLLEKIGEGGCGMVYMAEQEEPVRRKVALKIIKAGMDSRQVIARFEAERQALAMMDHPNIAQFFDAGTIQTQSGERRMQNPSADSPLHTLHSPLGSLPYFVMELVRGVRITDYCTQNNLPTRQRLDLFIQVCHAVQHAHQKGIIHRDLKPSNILVTENDGKPVPKVIDFGIAKATEGRLTDKTVFTQFAAFMGTPAYMSPEQAAMTSLDIDTRSDIYSLGVLLYELLTGTTPFDAQELLKAGFDEMRRVIRETEPEKPSTRLTQRLRRGPQSPLVTPHSSLATDLDWIVMKCLEKDRQRRYDTANGLAADIKRHLCNEAVLACPPSAAYRIRKVIRRHRWAWAAAGVVAASLVMGIIVASGQARRADRESQRALAAEAKAKAEAASSEQVARFLARMLEGIGPSVALGRDTTLLREILARTERRMTEDLASQPEAEARLCASLSRIYFDLHDLPKAESMANRVVELGTRLNRGEHATVRDALQSLGDIYSQRGDHVRAEEVHQEGLALLRRLDLGGGKTEASQLNSLATAVSGLGDHARAEALYREGLKLLHQRGDGEQFVTSLLINLALERQSRGDHIEAENLSREVVELLRKKSEGDSPSLAIALSNLATTLKIQGKLEEAERLSREALTILRRFLGERGGGQVRTMEGLIYILEEKGDLVEAERLSREALAIRRQAPANEKALAETLDVRTRILMRRERWSEAEDHAKQALELWRGIPGAENKQVLDTLSQLASCLREQNRLPEAEAVLREALAIRRGASHPDRRLADILSQLTSVLVQRGQLAEAAQRGRESQELWERLPTEDQNNWQHHIVQTGLLLQKRDRREEAQHMFEGLLALQRSLLGPGSLEESKTLLTLSNFQLKPGGDPSVVERYARAAVEIRRRHRGPAHKDVVEALNSLAYGLQYHGRLAEAEGVLRDCLTMPHANVSSRPSERRGLLDSLIECLVLQGKEAEAMRLVQMEWNTTRMDMSADGKEREDCLADFAEMFSKPQGYAEAEPLYRELIASRASRLSAEHDDVIKPKASLARLLANWAWAERSGMVSSNAQPVQRAREAERVLREVLAIRNSLPDQSPRRLGDTRSRLGAALLSLAFLQPGLPPDEREIRLREAESEMLAGQELMTQRRSTDLRYVRHGLERLFRLYEAWGKPEQANVYRAKLKTFGLTEATTQAGSTRESSP